MDKIEELFKMLDDWRKLPAYQLERRADIFFALYLKEILGESQGTSNDLIIIPEFPLISKGNHTNKVDYFVWDRIKNKTYLIELKTDKKSVNKKQINYLMMASKKSPIDLLMAIEKVAISKNADAKYKGLFKYLKKHQVLDYEGDLPGKWKSHWKTLINNYKRNFTIINVNHNQVIYILPKEDHKIPKEMIQIDFLKIEKYISNKDEIANLFCKSLRDWI
ncbi:MAG: hypothetical protein PHV30_06990 [Candidatus Margulisbacteria bacterium]|nr:hypothetical protein [Candidatus Margulisiibacteriota bacterium]